jgi:hypothetical protein
MPVSDHSQVYFRAADSPRQTRCTVRSDRLMAEAHLADGCHDAHVLEEYKSSPELVKVEAGLRCVLLRLSEYQSGLLILREESQS